MKAMPTVDQKARKEAAAFIRQARKEKDLSRIKVSNLIGYSTQGFLYLVETGQKPLPKDKILPLASALDLDPIDLYRRCYPDESDLMDVLLASKIATNSSPAADPEISKLIQLIRSHPGKAKALAPTLTKILHEPDHSPGHIQTLVETLLSLPETQRQGLIMAFGGGK